MKLNFLILNIPINFNFIIIKKFNIFHIIVYNLNFVFKLIINNKNNLKINKNINQIKYKNVFLKTFLYLVNNKFTKFLKKLDSYYYSKIKFKGKGYKIRIYKKKKIINFFFGSSHKTIINYKNLIIKRPLKNYKYKFILFTNNFEYFKNNVKKTVNIKKVNFFTGRGIRSSRQNIIRRKGKKGSFI